MNNLGYNLVNPYSENGPQIIPIQYINENAIKGQLSTIYHYHGTCPEGSVVNSDFKVKHTENIFIGDISVLNKPWGGSTSVPAMVTGYICSKNFTN